MQTKFKMLERLLGSLLFVAIVAIILSETKANDIETIIFYLFVSVILWAIPSFFYVFIRDIVIALRWKKPAFPLPQYESEKAELERMRESWDNNPSNPASPIYSDWWNMKG